MLKARTGRLGIIGDVVDFVSVRIQRYDLSLLDLQFLHLARFYQLPAHHRDPFDQLLVAQAQVVDLPILTADAQIKKYEVEVIW